MSQGGRYDGSVSIGNSRRPSRSTGPSLQEHILNQQNHMPTSGYSMSESAFSLTSSLMESSLFSNPKALLEFSDSVRRSISEKSRFAPPGPELERLSLFLETALDEETRGVPTLDFTAIKTARLDKLVADMISWGTRITTVSAKSRAFIDNAARLQRAWRTRFRSLYFMIDEIRTVDLATSGSLREVSFITPTRTDTAVPNAWRASEMEPVSSIEGNLHFRVGQWWLNMACAHRDGIVGSELEKPTTGRYDNSALPLLTGREEQVGEGRVKYHRQGRLLSDMHVSLLCHTGRNIRILRGYRLRSSYAPRAGVRYDGLHRLDTPTETYSLELVLERSEGQLPMEDVMKIPMPSQLDDWRLFEKLEAENIRQTTGEQEALEWRMRNEEDRREREEWQRVREFRSSISAGAARQAAGLSPLTVTLTAPVQKSAMKLKLPPEIQAKADRAEREAKLKRAVIDTSRNEERYLSRSGESTTPEHSLR
ncbi:PUA-like domain-containing protein [Lasiosphaeris hirsuta]|uniref:PUA-like domain-containing protein n=1 Tax=Lasiosphaeris hirsuta TaxID=260670 RepID=A0AA40A9D4_9PEZI|nr:PUA-like domain-containing protein [Lasiosphaeris hirsuta]